MDPYGGGFSYEQARKERESALMGGWEQMRWLVSDVRDLIAAAIEGGNQEIVRESIRLPIRISRLALQNDDHYLFQEFSWFPGLYYRYSQKEEIQSEIRSYLFDQSWKHFESLSKYYIETKLKKNIPDAKKLSLKDFAITILVTYQNLMKASYDNNDIEGFRRFQQTTLSLFTRTNRESKIYDIEHIESLLETPNISKERQTQLLEQLEVHLLFQDIYNRRFQMFFGLASWILDEYKKDQENIQIKELYNSTQSIFNISLEEFTQIFLDTHTFDTEDFWNWDHWDTIPDGMVHTIRILEKLEQFFVVKALSLLTGRTKEEIDQIALPYNRDLAYLAEGTRDLIKTLDDIENNPVNWQFVLSEDAIKLVEEFKAILSRAKDQQELDDLERKRATQISDQKVNEFMDDFINGFYRNADLRSIIKTISSIEMRLSEIPNDEIRRFGFNTVDDKAAFFDDWHVHFGKWGEGYGRNLAAGENSAILKKIIESCEHRDGMNFNSIFSEFRKKENILILLVNSASYFVFQGIEDYRYQNVRNNKWLTGIFEFKDVEIPIYEFFQINAEKKIIILDKSNVGKIVQYLPLEESDPDNLLRDIFSMEIYSFSENEDLLNEFLKSPPDWLKEKGNSESQRLYLKERVSIKIEECFDLVLSNDFQGYSIRSNIPDEIN